MVIPEEAATPPNAEAKGAPRWVSYALLVGIAVAILLVVLFSEQPSTPLGQGSPAPVFSLPNLEGSETSLEDFRGRVVLLNFWATWCKPCKDEMPSMERLYQELREEGFELVAVSVDEEAAPVLEFRDRYELTFPILLDAEMYVSPLYQTYRYPESLLIDRKGTIISRFVGPRDWSDPIYVTKIRDLLAGGE